ncbi:hypothetical protein [Brevibacterium sp. Marseille-P9724]|uniref:hypothetical protein n=1 Tax=Brevibacterium sp. Marseille-P9724 TaxID=2614125 RepID=UPI00125FDCB1|nr:hypothetical protein [Brevibacterium sp. Marseille-P9724]
MSSEPEVALEAFIAAIREHYAAAVKRTSDTDERVEAAYMALADAYEVYEDALYVAYDEVTPFELFDDIEDAREDGTFDDDFDDFDDDDDFDDPDSDDDEDDD